MCGKCSSENNQRPGFDTFFQCLMDMRSESGPGSIFLHRDNNWTSTSRGGSPLFLVAWPRERGGQRVEDILQGGPLVRTVSTTSTGRPARSSPLPSTLRTRFSSSSGTTISARK